MTVLDNYLKNFMPSKEAAKVHIKLTIKEYGQLEEYKFYKQLDITSRGLYVAGFNHLYSVQLVSECLEEAGYDKHVWYDSREFDEIVKPREVKL